MLRPLKNKVVIEMNKKENVSAGGIILTKSNDSHDTGRVISIGPDVMDISVGDTVLPNWNAATKTNDGGQTLYIISEADVVMIFGE